MFALLLATAIVSAGGEFPFDEDMKASFGTDEISVSITYRVSKKEDKYVYMYSIKNTSKVPVKFRCVPIQDAMYFGFGADMIYDLKPDEHMNFVLEHPDPPARAFGQATIYSLSDQKEFNDELAHLPDVPKGVKMQVPNKPFYKGHNGNVIIPLPQSFTKGQGRLGPRF